MKNIQNLKSYDGKIKIYFLDNDAPKEDYYCICLSVILIDSALKNIICKYFWKSVNML